MRFSKKIPKKQTKTKKKTKTKTKKNKKKTKQTKQTTTTTTTFMRGATCIQRWIFDACIETLKMDPKQVFGLIQNTP